MVQQGRRVTVAVLVTVGLAIGVAGAGDRDVAEFFFTKGEKAYRKRAYEEAESFCRRALAEHTPYPEAAHRLGMALEKLGRGPDALKAYLLAEEHFGELPSLTRKQKRLLASVKKAISRIGAGYAELGKLDDEFVKVCVGLSRKYFNSQPEWAKKACESALAIDPTNKLARGFLDKLEAAEAPTSGGGIFTSLIQSDSLENWDPGIEKPWSCSGGVMTADVVVPVGSVNAVKLRLEGTFEFQAAFREIRAGKVKRSHGLLFGYKPDGTAWSLLYDWNSELALIRWDAEGDRVVKSKILTGFRANRWHMISIRVKEDEVTALLDGDVVFVYAGEGKDAFDGTIGVFAQDMKLEVKEVGMRE